MTRAIDDDQRERLFLARIASLYPDDRGRLATLRRASGKRLAEAIDAHWVLGLMAELGFAEPESATDRAKEQRRFFVATLLANHRVTLRSRLRERSGNDDGASAPAVSAPSAERDEPTCRVGRDSFGKTMAELCATGALSEESGKVRLRQLLDAMWDEDGGTVSVRLRQLVALADSAGIAIHWPTLLRDLHGWDHPARHVQLRWARDFYRALVRNNAPSNSESKGESSNVA